MKAIVDEETCTGCEQCAEICPEVFEMEDGLARVTADPVPETAREKTQEAAEDCPVEAITIET